MDLFGNTYESTLKDYFVFWRKKGYPNYEANNYNKINELIKLIEFDEKTIYKDNYSQEITVLINNIQIGNFINQQQVTDMCRLVLREYVWTKLSYDSKMYVHFGYDYYMYIGSLLPCKETIRSITNQGLFVKKFKSPYCNDPQKPDTTI